MTDSMVVLGGLDLDARRLFIAIASGMIDGDQAHIELDCSQVDALDEQTLGMLVTVAHNAQRRGQRAVLDAASERVHREEPMMPVSATCSPGPHDVPVGAR